MPLPYKVCGVVDILDVVLVGEVRVLGDAVRIIQAQASGGEPHSPDIPPAAAKTPVEGNRVLLGQHD